MDFWEFFIWLWIFAGIFAGFWILSKLSVPQRDYSNDWRADL